MLTGHTIYLRKPCQADVTEEGWLRWYNDPELTRFNDHGVFPLSLDEERDIVRSNMADKDSILMAICNKDDDRVVGNISLQSIHRINRSCRLAITMGDTSLTAGVEAYGLMTQHAFERLNLNRIADATHQELETFVHMISIFGYRIEGRGREHYIHGDRRADSIMFACLAENYFSGVVARDNAVLFKDADTLKSEMIEATRRKAAALSAGIAG